MKRLTLLSVLTSAALLAFAADAAAQTADDFPNRPIRIIVPQAAGSGIDLLRNQGIHARRFTPVYRKMAEAVCV